MRRKAFQFWDLVRLISETWRYIYLRKSLACHAIVQGPYDQIVASGKLCPLHSPHRLTSNSAHLIRFYENIPWPHIQQVNWDQWVRWWSIKALKFKPFSCAYTLTALKTPWGLKQISLDGSTETWISGDSSWISNWYPTKHKSVWKLELSRNSYDEDLRPLTRKAHEKLWNKMRLTWLIIEIYCLLCTQHPDLLGNCVCLCNISISKLCQIICNVSNKTNAFWSFCKQQQSTYLIF